MMPFTINDLQLHNQNILGPETVLSLTTGFSSLCVSVVIFKSFKGYTVLKTKDHWLLIQSKDPATNTRSIVSGVLLSVLDPKCCHLRVILTRQLLRLMRLLTLTENSQAVSQSEAYILSDDQSEAWGDLEPWRPSVSSEDERFMGPWNEMEAFGCLQWSVRRW